MENKVLITFLGKGKENHHQGYRTARYQFNDQIRETAFFGLALSDFLKPDKLIVVGTSGSQWSALVENIVDSKDSEERVFELAEAEIENRVNQGLLDKFKSSMEQAIGLPVVPCLIPYGKSEEEQIEILKIITGAVPNQECNVSFDLTHGFRHLGMIGFLSAFLLERIYNLSVESLWYGALDMTSKEGTPVIKLSGLIKVREWIDALDRFDSTGNYGVVSKLLEEDGVNQSHTSALKRAAFHEYTTNLGDAARRLDNFLPALGDQISGASGLFQEKLATRLSWARQNSLAEQQCVLAEHYLRKGDFLRAAIFGWESFITQYCNENEYHETEQRSEAKECLKSEMDDIKNKGSSEQKAYHNLRQIRNTLAHGNPPDNIFVRRFLRNEDALLKALEESFRILLK